MSPEQPTPESLARDTHTRIVEQEPKPVDQAAFRAAIADGTFKRKAWMRNMPCACGSGRKFKKCCWRFA